MGHSEFLKMPLKRVSDNLEIPSPLTGISANLNKRKALLDFLPPSLDGRGSGGG